MLLQIFWTLDADLFIAPAPEADLVTIEGLTEVAGFVETSFRFL